MFKHSHKLSLETDAPVWQCRGLKIVANNGGGGGGGAGSTLFIPITPSDVKIGLGLMITGPRLPTGNFFPVKLPVGTCAVNDP